MLYVIIFAFAREELFFWLPADPEAHLSPWLNADFRKVRRTNARALKQHEIWERRVVETADAVVVNTPRSLDDFLVRYGNKWSDKLTVIPNGLTQSSLRISPGCGGLCIFIPIPQ